MKSLLLSVSLGAILALMLIARGAALDVGDYIGLAFASLLVGWYLASYVRSPRRSVAPRPAEPVRPATPPWRKAA